MPGPEHAVIAVAGERAARLLTGTGGGATTDYRQAEAELAGTGRTVDWAEQHADDVITTCRRDITTLARRLYRHGHR